MSVSLHSSPALILMKTDGRRVPVCGRNLQAALWAAALVDAVLRRGEETPLPMSRQGGLKRVCIDEATLSWFLRDVYGTEPETIAEAIMTLRKLDRLKAAWLRNVLQSTPELTATSWR